MKIRSLIVSLAVGLSAVAGMSPALAEVITFTAPANFAGGSLNGFTFSSNWMNYGSDPRNAPFMQSYGQNYTMTYDNGSFDFEAMSIGAWPWIDFNFSLGETVNIDFTFRDINGDVLATDSLALNQNNSFYTYAKSVANVHEIDTISSNGWPRLDSVTINAAAAPVPEPETYAMMMVGFGLMGVMSRRRKAKQA